MVTMIKTKSLSGVWSAAPTPFTEEMEIDTESIKRMVDHHFRLGVKGLFLGGTNGEGPWLPERSRRKLVQEVVKYTKKRMWVAFQVTDNSVPRILDNIQLANKDGADIAVIAPPYCLFNATPQNILNLYREVIHKSSLPVGIYDRGKNASVFVPDAVLRKIYAEKNVLLVKDSSTLPQRRNIALAAKQKRPELRLLNGWEFNCVEYLKAGYDGLLLGGGIFNGYLAGQIIQAVRTGNFTQAEKLQRRMNRIMYAVYGGKKLKCWLSGEKKLLVEMGIFRTWKNYLNYPLTENCLKAIQRVLEKEADILFPWRKEE